MYTRITMVLCNSDNILFKNYNENDFSKVLFLHIPKTAGASFKRDMNSYGNFNLTKTEFCYQELLQFGNHSDKLPYMVTFLRNPRSHVLSQFFECKYDLWGKVTTMNTAFPRNSSDVEDFILWVNHFYEYWKISSDKKLWNINNASVVDDFNCYTPYNMQARALSNECVDSHHDHSSINYINLTSYVDNFHSLPFVGVVEYFRVSFCMVWFYVGEKFTRARDLFCRESYEQSHVRHGVPDHSDITLYPDSVWDKVDEMTQLDLKLYNMGVQRLLKNFEELRSTYNIDFIDIYNGKLPIDDNIYYTFGDKTLDPLPVTYSTDDELELVVGVATKPEDVEIRKAWRYAIFLKQFKGLKFIFVLNNTTSTTLMEEYQQYNDMVFLPTKEHSGGLYLYQWLRYAKSHYKSILYGKIDAHSLLCPSLLMLSLQKHRNHWNNLYYGWFHHVNGHYRADDFLLVVGNHLVDEILNAKYYSGKYHAHGGTSLMKWINYIKITNNSTIRTVEANTECLQGNVKLSPHIIQNSCNISNNNIAVYHVDYYKSTENILSSSKYIL